MLKNIKSKLLGLAVAGSAVSSFAAAPSWATDTATTSAMTDVIAAAAPVAIGVVVGVAGIRIFIKLINRGAGK